MQRLLNLSRVLLATAALMVIASTSFAALGLNLSWNDCGAAGAAQKNFACTSNSGASILYASVAVGTDMNQLNGMAGVIDLQTNEAALSDWWNVGASGCRATNSLSADFNFLANFTCSDPWVGSAAGGMNYTYQFNGVPNRARIRTVCAIPGSNAINGTDEYYMFKVNILNLKTTGTGACAGCVDGACIVLNSILVTQPLAVGDDRTITSELGQRYVLWQAGGSSIGGLGCPNEVPTRNQTWGSVKSLYR